MSTISPNNPIVSADASGNFTVDMVLNSPPSGTNLLLSGDAVNVVYSITQSGDTASLIGTLTEPGAPGYCTVHACSVASQNQYSVLSSISVYVVPNGFTSDNITIMVAPDGMVYLVENSSSSGWTPNLAVQVGSLRDAPHVVQTAIQQAQGAAVTSVPPSEGGTDVTTSIACYVLLLGNFRDYSGSSVWQGEAAVVDARKLRL